MAISVGLPADSLISLAKSPTLDIVTSESHVILFMPFLWTKVIVWSISLVIRHEI